MLSSDQRLYTWVDVEDVLQKLKQDGSWPSWLITVRAYWDGLTLEIDEIDNQSVCDKIAEWFDPRFEQIDCQPLIGKILLESSNTKRDLQVFVESAEHEGNTERSFIPTWGRPLALSSFLNSVAPSPLENTSVPVVGLHSFKGGVGRTVTSLSLARQIANTGQKVLLLDADFEAPGISWLIQKRIPNPPFALSDFLSLIHSEPNLEEVVELSANRIVNMFVDGIFVVPAFRTMDQFAVLEIRPEHILQSAQNPYVLTEAFSRLASKLGASIAIVDLRAGLSELSAGLMLDPRVFRVCVSTLGGQSLAGTQQILKTVARIAPSTSTEEPVPAVVLSQVPRQDFYADVISKRLNEVSSWLADCTNSESDSPPVFMNYFDPTLSVLPADWEEVSEILSKSDSGNAAISLTEWIGLETKQDTSLSAEFDFIAKRTSFSEWSGKLIYAEKSSVTNLLLTKPLTALLSDHRTRVPIAVIVGPKGAGKTYTYLQLNQRTSWKAFAADVGEEPIKIDALIAPVLQPKNLDDVVARRLSDKRISIANQLGFNKPGLSFEIYDEVVSGLAKDLTQSDWRKIWLQLIAFSLGFNRHADPSKLIEELVKQNSKVIATFDGLEDIFQDISVSEKQKVALRALLQDVPDWLSQQPERPLGLAIFVREDMVLDAISQNARQLMNRYDSYALRWSHLEVLRLVVWMCIQSEVMFGEVQLSGLDETELRELLARFWGRKLGTDKSREARTADWVLGALSGPKRLIQARDVVRLTSYAAEKSINDNRWHDRLLVPTAIRASLSSCSNEKVEEIMLENVQLGTVLKKLQQLPKNQRVTPFKPLQLENLTAEDFTILELNGVIVRIEDSYEIPEIFRYGLQFERVGGARPKVLRQQE